MLARFVTGLRAVYCCIFVQLPTFWRWFASQGGRNCESHHCCKDGASVHASAKGLCSDSEIFYINRYFFIVKKSFRNCREIISTCQDASCKSPTVYAFAGSGRRAAPLEMWTLLKDNPSEEDNETSSAGRVAGTSKQLYKKN